MIDYEFRVSSVSKTELMKYLSEQVYEFTPPLYESVNIDEYSAKLCENAITFELWSDNSIIGIIAAYFNNKLENVGYISLVSIGKGYSGKGLASFLVEQCIEYAKKHEVVELMLQVEKANNNAVNLYKKYGFVTSREQEKNEMRLKIEQLD